MTRVFDRRRAMRKMSLADLLDMQDKLDSELVAGVVNLKQYEDEWDGVLAAAGWTEKEYERAIDDRWDDVARPKDLSSIVVGTRPARDPRHAVN